MLRSSSGPLPLGQGLASKSPSNSPTKDGLVIWLEANRGVTVADGLVTAWQNQVSVDSLSPISGASPAFNPTGSGSGRQAIEFTGLEDLSNSGWQPIPDASPRTYLAAFTPTLGSPAPPDGGTIMMIGSSPFSTIVYGDGTFSTNFIFTDGLGNQAITNPHYGVPMVGSWQCTAGSLVTFQRNGVADATVSGAAVVSPGGAGVFVGVLAAAAALNFRGVLSGILGYKKILGTVELAHNTAYLTQWI